MEFITILLVLVSLFIGFSIGANDSANCMGTSVGAGILNYKKAALLVGVFALIGAVLQGGNTMKTIGKGVVDPVGLTDIAIISALLAAAIFVSLSTYRGIPVSTTQAVIGSIAAMGVAAHTVVNWGLIGKLFMYWVLSPLIAVFCSYLAYLTLEKTLRRFSLIILDKIIYALVIGSGIFLAYSVGANNLGNAMGLVVSRNILIPVVAGVAGGLFIAFGSILLGKNVMKTVGSGITVLDARAAFAAQLGGGITIYLLTALSVPTSTSHAVIGGIAGVGLVKGIASINKTEIKRILRGWIVTPLLSAVVALIIFFILNSII